MYSYQSYRYANAHSKPFICKAHIPIPRSVKIFIQLWFYRYCPQTASNGIQLQGLVKLTIFKVSLGSNISSRATGVGSETNPSHNRVHVSDAKMVFMMTYHSAKNQGHGTTGLGRRGCDRITNTLTHEQIPLK